MSQSFNNRCYGCAIIKAQNANYNADFSHQPRTLPDGTVYATDKALKYSVRNFWDKVLGEKVFYFKSINEEMIPRTLDETLTHHFGPEILKESDKKKLRRDILRNILKCIDVRVFGGTYAGKTNLSLHGTTQFTHGVNRFHEGVIYSEQISSPFRNPSEKSKDSQQSTLGTQSKLQEGHYVHHLSVNPRNLSGMAEMADHPGLLADDIDMLKLGLRRGVTYYDSAAKAGCENELLLWVTLKEDSKAVLPSFVDLVSINEAGEIDLSKLTEVLQRGEIADEIKHIELYYNDGISKVVGAPNGAEAMPL